MFNIIIYICLVLHLYFPSVRKDSFGVTFLNQLQGHLYLGIQSHKCVPSMMELQCPCHSYYFCLLFSLLFYWDGCIMVCHVVHLFCCAVKLDGLTTLFVASGAGFLFIVLLMRSVLGGLFLE